MPADEAYWCTTERLQQLAIQNLYQLELALAGLLTIIPVFLTIKLPEIYRSSLSAADHSGLSTYTLGRSTRLHRYPQSAAKEFQSAWVKPNLYF
jgi:hypothetical protein